MTENLVQFFIDNLGDKISPEFIAFIVSALPVIELRGGLFAAKLLGIEFFKGFAICFIGNMLPIPFILLFIRKIFDFLKRNEKIKNIIDKLEARSIKKADKIEKYKLWGLFIFVAIPLPGTGAWTGALAADLFNLKIKHALPVIAGGVFVAGIIISIFSYGLLGLLGI